VLFVFIAVSCVNKICACHTIVHYLLVTECSLQNLFFLDLKVLGQTKISTESKRDKALTLSIHKDIVLSMRVSIVLSSGSQC